MLGKRWITLTESSDEHIETYNLMWHVMPLISGDYCSKAAPSAELSEFVKYDITQYDSEGVGLLQRMFPRNVFDLDSGVIYDSWGNPIKLDFKSPAEYALISFGPNGKDDHGQKDDIFIPSKGQSYISGTPLESHFPY
jgi:hypothetical protein